MKCLYEFNVSYLIIKYYNNSDFPPSSVQRLLEEGIDKCWPNEKYFVENLIDWENLLIAIAMRICDFEFVPFYIIPETGLKNFFLWSGSELASNPDHKASVRDYSSVPKPVEFETVAKMKVGGGGIETVLFWSDLLVEEHGGRAEYGQSQGTPTLLKSRTLPQKSQMKSRNHTMKWNQKSKFLKAKLVKFGIFL